MAAAPSCEAAISAAQLLIGDEGEADGVGEPHEPLVVVVPLEEGPSGRSIVGRSSDRMERPRAAAGVGAARVPIFAPAGAVQDEPDG